jgi:hypothetical protein
MFMYNVKMRQVLQKVWRDIAHRFISRARRRLVQACSKLNSLKPGLDLKNTEHD